MALEVYPNPANYMTTVRYSVESGEEVGIGIYNIVGKKLLDIDAGIRPPGYHTEHVDMANLVPGIYIVALRTGARTAYAKLVVWR